MGSGSADIPVDTGPYQNRGVSSIVEAQHNIDGSYGKWFLILLFVEQTNKRFTFHTPGSTHAPAGVPNLFLSLLRNTTVRFLRSERYKNQFLKKNNYGTNQEIMLIIAS
jgi:hypothetical protein